MVLEDGIDWLPLEPDKRGRHATFRTAVEAAAREISAARSEFFDSIADRWSALFPGFSARPGRYEDGKLVLYVKSAPHLFALNPRLPAVRKKLMSLEGAPKKLKLILEIRT